MSLKSTTQRLRTLCLTALLIGAVLVGVSSMGQAAADGTDPVITSVTYQDVVNVDGFIDQVTVVFDEPMDDSTIRAGDFRIGGAPARTVATGNTANDNTILLGFFAGDVPDTGALPEFTYQPGTAKDMESPNPGSLGAVGLSDVAETDGAAPRLLAAAAQAGSTEILVTFSEPVTAKTAPMDAGEFCFVDGSGTTPSTLDTGTYTVDANQVVVKVTPALEAADIGALGAQLWAKVGTGDCTAGTASVEDGASSPNDADPSVSVRVRSPAFRSTGGSLEVQGDVGSKFIRVTFNMPVQKGASAAPLDQNDFSLNNAGGRTITAVSHVVGSSVAILELSSALTAAEFAPTPMEVDVAAGAVAVYGEEHITGDLHVAQGPATVVDKRAPRISTSETIDSDGNGVVDAVKVTFNEFIEDDGGAALVESIWELETTEGTVIVEDVVTGGTSTDCAGDYTPNVEDDGIVFLCIDQSAAGAPDTGTPLAISYAGSSATDHIEDLAGNPMLNVDAWPVTDTAPPVLLSAATADADADGKLDNYTLTFSEPIDDSTFIAANWSVGGSEATGKATGTADDAVMTLQFAEAAAPNTDALPQVTYTPGTTKLVGLDGLEVAAIANADVTETDAAPPILVSAVGVLGDTEVTLTFSEPVKGTGTGDVIRKEDLSYAGGSGGATSISSVSHTKGDETATVTLNVALTSGDLGVDEVNATADTILEDKDTAPLSVPDTPVTVTAPSDDTAPAAITDLASEGVGTGGTSVTLSWTAPGDDGSTGQVTSYVIKRSASTITAANFDSATTVADADRTFDPSTLAAAGATQNVTISGLTADTTYFFAVKAVDDAGNRGAVSNVVEVTTDVTVPAAVASLTSDDDAATPNSVRLVWNAPADADVAEYEIRQAASAITAANVDSAANVTDVTLDPDDLAAPGGSQAAVVAGLEPETEYFFAVRAVDGNGNKGPWAFSTGVSTTADTTAPVGTLSITTSTHASPSTSQNATFSWSGVTDDESAVTYRYALTKSSNHTFKDDDETTAATNVTLSDVGIGTWRFHLRAESPGGDGDEASLTIHVKPTKSLAEVNEALQATLKVTRSGGDAVLTWDRDAVDPVPTGIQVWRSTSPFEVIATLTEGQAAFDDEEYRDEDAPKSAAYIITAFYGDHVELGKFGSTADLSDVPGYAGLSEEEAREKATLVPAGDDGLPAWLWVLIVVVVILVVVVVIVAIILATRKKGKGEDHVEQGGWAAAGDGWDDEWSQPEEQTFHLTCPRCDHDFAATGIKPLTTTCPNCQVKGVLR